MAVDSSILVVGCGVIGLTTAIELVEHGHRVAIITRDESPRTTSDVAAAFWYPYRAGFAPRTLEWARTSYERFRALASEHAGASEGSASSARRASEQTSRPVCTPELEHTPGVVRRRLRQLTSSHEPERTLADIADGFAELASEDLPPDPRWRCGVTFDSFVAETPRYMPWLREQFLAHGGTIEVRDVASLDALANDASIVVDCAGLAARELASDPLVHPIRGQVLRVRRDAGTPQEIVDSVDEDFIAYIVPRRDDVILGGTATDHDWDLAPSADATRGILERCRAIWPALGEPEILETRVGLRPGRSSVRLELERRGSLDVIHNYGHGGAGFTLSWGCAEEVVRLVEQR